MKTLKCFVAGLTLAAFSGAALAEWVEIEKFDDGIRVFADAATARHSGDTAQLEHLVRWAEPQVEPGLPPYLSTRVLAAYDCAGKRERYLASTSYAGTMGNGAKIVADDSEAEDWYSISASSMEEKLWKIACAAK
jgi:hypothetical protein